MEGCTCIAEGQIGLCISHGGGHCCQFQSCTKVPSAALSSAKHMVVESVAYLQGAPKVLKGALHCAKGMVGESTAFLTVVGFVQKVHGGTKVCVAHGGGKRCFVPGCTKSARGRTDCCVRHGGGKRCKVENCEKSAQGYTDICKAHGGGKRCEWGEGKCEKFARGKSGLCSTHCSMAQEQRAKKGGMIGPGLFHGLVPAASSLRSSFDKTCSSPGVSLMSDSIDSLQKPAKWQHLLPTEVLVPLSMKSSSSYSRSLSSENQEYGSRIGGGISSSGIRKSSDFVIPEGRVHGGGLMSLLGGNLRNPIDGI